MTNAWTLAPSVLSPAPRKEDEELYLVPFQDGMRGPFMTMPAPAPAAYDAVQAIADGQTDPKGQHYLKYGAKALAKGNEQVLHFLVEKRQYIYSEMQAIMKLYVAQGNALTPQVAQQIIDRKKAIQQTIARDFRMFPTSRIAAVNRDAAKKLGLLEGISASGRGEMLDDAARAAARTPVGMPHRIKASQLARAEHYVRGVKYFGLAVDLAPEVATLLTSHSKEEQEKALRNGAKVVAKEVGVAFAKPIAGAALRSGALWAARSLGRTAVGWCLVAFLGFTPSGLVLLGIAVAVTFVGEFLLKSFVAKGTDWLVDMKGNAMLELRMN